MTTCYCHPWTISAYWFLPLLSYLRVCSVVWVHSFERRTKNRIDEKLNISSSLFRSRSDSRLNPVCMASNDVEHEPNSMQRFMDIIDECGLPFKALKRCPHWSRCSLKSIENRSVRGLSIWHGWSTRCRKLHQLLVLPRVVSKQIFIVRILKVASLFGMFHIAD